MMRATSVMPFSPNEYPAPTHATSVFNTHTPASRTSFTISRCNKGSTPFLGYKSDCVHKPISTPCRWA